MPSEQDVPLWEMENDYYLHNSRVKDGGLVAQRRYLQMMRDWEQDEDDEDEDRVMGEVRAAINRPTAARTTHPLLRRHPLPSCQQHRGRYVEELEHVDGPVF